LKRDINNNDGIHTSFRVGMTSVTIGTGVRNLVLLCSVFTNISSGEVRPLSWKKMWLPVTSENLKWWWFT